MKLWQKGGELDQEIERFTVGNDYLLDQRLVPFDCQASAAHARMLAQIGLLTPPELGQLLEGLAEIEVLAGNGEFLITAQDEDCHTAIENFLVAKYGEVGKKIHCTRSRNDQVLTALRLYEKDQLRKLQQELENFISGLESLIAKNGSVQMPGYTHMRPAMPSSMALWLGCFRDSVQDDLISLKSVFDLIDQSPLGTAAGYGVPVFPIDRNLTRELLNFARVQENPIYAQLSRGKFEGMLVSLCSQVMLGLNKLSSDLLLFSMKEFGFVSLPAKMCTGSSIMPQKKNPDVLELIRAKYHVVLAEEFKIKGMIGNLISGYHRDFQLLKEAVFNAFDITNASLRVMNILLGELEINVDNCQRAMSEELYATEKAYLLVKEQGISFRDAYRQIGTKYK